jgi:hypothetical protein
VANKTRNKDSFVDQHRGSIEPKDVLPSIDRLLDAVSNLMKHEPSIDRQAFEHMRQLRVRIRFAISNSERIANTNAVSKAPAKWLDRADKNESQIDFIAREYAELLGRVSRPDIKRLDKSLYAALANWVSQHGALPPEIDLPTKKQLNDRKLKVAGTVKAPSRSKRVSEMTESDVEKLRLYDLARKRSKKDDQ